jgi:WD repeat-containing protein 68
MSVHQDLMICSCPADSLVQIYGLSFSNSPLNPLRTALTSYAAGPSNKLSVLDTVHPSSSSSSSHAQAQSPSGAPQNFYQQASHGLMFPATKVGWEPAESVVHAGREEEGGRGELLATTGDVLRIWEVGLDWSEERGRGFVGRSYGYNGQGQGQGQGQSQPQGHALSTRSVLTNVSWEF